MFVRLVDWLLTLGTLVGFLVLGWWAVYQSPDNAETLQFSLQQKAEIAVRTTGQVWASVEMDGQRAIIRGSAPSLEALEAVEKALLFADGAGGFVFGGVTVAEQIDEIVDISPYVWTATKTDDGRIILTGYVPAQSIRESIVADAELIAPGKIEDRLQIGTGAPQGNWQGAARLGLQQLAFIDTGMARMDDSRLTVSGIAMDDEARIRVSADVANIAMPFTGHPEIIGSSLWAAKHEPDGLMLTGKIATEEERAQITEIAQEFYSGNVIDEMVVTDQDYQGWMDGVELGLPHFSKFTSGEMDFNPEGGGFTFNGEASGSTLVYLREDLAMLTGPYSAEIKAEIVQVAVEEIAGIDFSADAKAGCQTAFDAVLVSNKVYFASGNSVITRESGVSLDKLMAVSLQCDSELIFELGGHTDNQGERTFNVWLSQERAQAVADYMTERGFEARRLFAVGHGPDIPAASNATQSGRAANRRIEFVVKDGNE